MYLTAIQTYGKICLLRNKTTCKIHGHSYMPCQRVVSYPASLVSLVSVHAKLELACPNQIKATRLMIHTPCNVHSYHEWSYQVLILAQISDKPSL